MTDPTPPSYQPYAQPYEPSLMSADASVPQFSPPPAPVTPRMPGWVWALIGGAVGVLLTAGIGAGVLLGRSDATTPAAVSGGQTFNVSGDLTLTDTTNLAGFGGVGGPCGGSAGYADISNGTQVVVTDAAGKNLAIGELAGATVGSTYTCVFEFTVNGVPVGVGPYSIEVSHRGKIVFTQDEATTLQLSLGGN